jgi:hypothetical protein
MLKIIALFAVMAFTVLLRKRLKGNHDGFGTALLVGLFAGLVSDGIFGYWLGLYFYGHIPFISWNYVLFLLPAWAMFGVVTWELWYLFSGKWWIRLLAATLLLLAFNEVIGYYMDSWEYLCPLWMVGIGWIGLESGIIGAINILRKPLVIRRRASYNKVSLVEEIR